MTLEEASAELTEIKEQVFAAKDTKQIAAINLGIEALKRIGAEREYEIPGSDTPLPGETT